MPLESANNFEQLDETWPLLGDTMKQTGGHIRQLKKVIKTIFPGINGNGFNIPIESTESEWNECVGLQAPIQPQLNTIKSNAILISSFIPYSGLFANIPSNYQLCDGTNGTPDLTDTFIMGTATQGEIGQTGGSADKIVPLHKHIMDHAHSVVLSFDGIHDHQYTVTEGEVGGGALTTHGARATDPITYTEKTTLDGAHPHTASFNQAILNTSTDGAAPTGLNNPQYIKLAFIMRIS